MIWDKEYQEQTLYRHYKGSKHIIVFIHGILEGTKQFRTLAEIAYNEGYSVALLLLPGHGGSSRYFATTNYMEWVRYVSNHITWLLSYYSKITIVGHSMGALLALCEKAVRGKVIERLVLIDPPLKVHLWPRVIKATLNINFGKVETFTGYTLAEYRAMSVGKITLGAVIGYLRRYSELLSIIGYTRKQIAKIDCPLLLVFANKDEFVSLHSYDYFRKYKGKIKIIYLEDSGHFCYHHSDLVKLEKAYMAFISNKT